MIDQNIIDWFIPGAVSVELKHGDHDQSTHGGDGDGGDKASAAAKLPKPKVMPNREIADSFVDKKGKSIYTLQKPTDGGDRGWVVTITSRRDKGGTPVHFLQMQGKQDEAIKEFSELKRWHA